jgi:hypothetical protein
MVMVPYISAQDRAPGCPAPPRATEFSAGWANAHPRQKASPVALYRFSSLERFLSHDKQNLQDLRRKAARIGFFHLAGGRFLRRVAIIKVTELCLMNLIDYVSYS